jgi:hypothetical protein
VSQAHGENFLITETRAGCETGYYDTDALAAFVAVVYLSRRSRPKAADAEWIAFGDEISPLQFER